MLSTPALCTVVTNSTTRRVASARKPKKITTPKCDARVSAVAAAEALGKGDVAIANEAGGRSDENSAFTMMDALHKRTDLSASEEEFLASQLSIYRAPYRGEHTAKAAFALLKNGSQVKSKAALEKVVDFALTPIEGHLPRHLFWERSYTEEETRAYLEKHWRMNLMTARALALSSIARSLPDRARVHDILAQILFSETETSNSLHFTALDILIRENLITHDDIDKIKELKTLAPPEDPEILKREIDGKIEREALSEKPLSSTLLGLAEKYHNQNYLVDRFAVWALRDPDFKIRSRAIDLFRKWKKLHPLSIVASHELDDIWPELHGYARHTAIEVLEASGRWSWGTKSTDEPKGPHYLHYEIRTVHDILRKLMYDLAIEINQETRLSQDERNRLAIIAYDGTNGIQPIENVIQAFPWGGMEMPPLRSAERLDKDPRVVDVHSRFPENFPSESHSMPDVDYYLRERLGPSVVDLLRSQLVDVEVFAGSLESAVQSGAIDYERSLKIPNFYSKWGIEKYFDFRLGAKPKVVFLIPPLRELALHYKAMLRRAGVKNPVVRLSEADRKELKADYKQAAKQLLDGFPKKPDSIVLGYDYEWVPYLKQHPRWHIRSVSQAETQSGGAQIRGTLIEIYHSEFPDKPRTLLLLNSEKRLWGEGSKHLLEGVLTANENQTRDFYFLGSAGAPGVAIQYGVSIPSEIRDYQGRPVLGYNSVYSGLFSTSLHVDEVEHDGLKIPRARFGTHGASYSPAEQTRKMVTNRLLGKGIETVDIETSLLAKTIAAYNEAHPKHSINFGVVHVITDLPAGENKTLDTGHDLSFVHTDRKRIAKLRAIEEVLESLEWRVFSSHAKHPFPLLHLTNHTAW